MCTERSVKKLRNPDRNEANPVLSQMISVSELQLFCYMHCTYTNSPPNELYGIVTHPKALEQYFCYTRYTYQFPMSCTIQLM